MTKIKDALANNGIFYFGAFGTNDPHYKELIKTQKEVDENTFFLEEFNSHAHFFKKEDLLETFKEFELLSISSEAYLELKGKQRYRGIVEYIGRKRTM